MTAAFASLLLAAAVAAEPEPSPLDALSAKPAFAEDASAAEIARACREMAPDDIEVKGHINRRSRHGTVVAAYRYDLKRKAGATELRVFGKDGSEIAIEKGGRLLDTDVTWSDLTLDFLLWDDVSFDETAGGESLHGVSCKVLLFKNGERAVRAWIDKRTGAMLQAEELRSGKVAREIFCTSVKKFGDRWAPKNIEVGPPGAKYRTKIVVEEVIHD